mgnify:CR=1 FL=1
MLRNAEEHLKKAKEAFEAKNFGEAFGQGNAAFRNAGAAAKSLNSILENGNEAINKINEVKIKIEKLSSAIEEFKAKFGDIPVSVIKVLEEAKLQLAKAEEALRQNNPRQALSHVQTAEKMIEKARSLLEGGKEAVQKRLEADTKRTDIKTEIKIEGESKKPEERPSVLEKLRTNIGVELQKPTESVTAFEVKPVSVASVKVRITANGFEPREVKIQKGGSIVWINESGNASWPASAVHPTHDVYPQKGGCIGSAFDACKRIENGGTYEFRFDHAGTWKYHDHINSSHFGSVNVAE